MEVIYSGLRQSPHAIARTALQEGVDAVGLSILSGAHLPLCQRVGEQLTALGVDDVLWLVGGNIPEPDHAALHKLGVHGIFATGTPFERIVAYVQDEVSRRRGAA